jgi:DNA-directed RNA polymerase alpha subunit
MYPAITSESIAMRVLLISVSELHLSRRIVQVLNRQEIWYLGTLIQTGPYTLMAAKLTAKEIQSIRTRLQQLNLDFDMTLDPEFKQKLHRFHQALYMDLWTIGLSGRVATVIENATGFHKVRDLIAMSEMELNAKDGIGPGTIKEIKQKLLAHGLYLGTKLPYL